MSEQTMPSEPQSNVAVEPDDARDPVSFGLALAAAVILGIAAILTAWGSFQASRADGDVTKAYAEQQALIASANDLYAQSDQASQLEQQFFLTYAINAAQGNEGAVAYLEQTMSEELAAAVVWWFDQPEETSPPTPFVAENPQYANLPSQVIVDEGNTVMDEADAKRVAAEESGELGGRFGLANVFFAIVLFLAGIATLLRRTPIQIGILVLSIALLVVGGVIIVSTPGWASIG